MITIYPTQAPVGTFFDVAAASTSTSRQPMTHPTCTFHPETTPLDSWSEDDCIRFTRSVAEKVIPIPLTDDDDLFNKGCDSIQATYIHNVIFQLLRSSLATSTPSGSATSSGCSTPLSRIASRSRSLPPTTLNFVYLHPTIRKLGLYIMHVVHYGHSSVALSLLSGKVSDMEGLVAKYSVGFPAPPRISMRRESSSTGEGGDVVLLTGTTGALGSHLLEALLYDPSVSKVYALNRRDASGSRSVYIRQTASFKERNLDYAALNSEKIELLEGDFDEDKLGLEDDLLYDEIRTSVTSIICCSWSTNPNYSLSTMEPLIAGLRRLIDLALASPRRTPPRFVFVSSLAVFSNWTPSQPAPEALNSRPVTAMGSGYAESKWVAEHVLCKAAEQTALRPTIVRFGKLSGSRNGTWSPRDWFPTLVRSALILRCLPSPTGHLSWFPVEDASALLMEIRNRPPQKHPRFLNAVHPNPVAATSIFQIFSEFLNVPLVPSPQWLHVLESTAHPHLNSSADPVKSAITNPAIILVEFYKSLIRPQGSRTNSGDSNSASGSSSPAMMPMECEAFGGLSVESTGAQEAAPRVFQDLVGRKLRREDVQGWLQYWSKVGYLSHSPRTR